MAWLIKIFINLCTCIMAIVHEKPYPHKTKQKWKFYSNTQQNLVTMKIYQRLLYLLLKRLSFKYMHIEEIIYRALKWKTHVDCLSLWCFKLQNYQCCAGDVTIDHEGLDTGIVVLPRNILSAFEARPKFWVKPKGSKVKPVQVGQANVCMPSYIHGDNDKFSWI